MRATLRLVCLGVLVGAMPASGQGAFEDAIQGFASSWSRGDVGGLSGSFASELRIHLLDREFNLLSRRQAGAAIEAFLGGRVTSKAEVLRSSETGREPRGGFAEIRWVSRADGTANETTYIIFVAIIESQGAWQVEEIRVLR